MAWLGLGALASGFVLQRLLGGDAPPNKVQELKNDANVNGIVLHRDDSMVLYAPNAASSDKKPIYEIVIHRPLTETGNSSFSLYRSETQEEAEEKFQAFLHRIPIFVQIAKEMFSINGLQKICDILSENPSWSLAHLVAYFNLTDYVKHPKIIEFLDYPDHANFLTPLQLAVKSENIEMVKVLLPCCKLEHLDNSSNSVFHYAASTSKEIINILTAKSVVNLNHCNADGYTPLHVACLADKPECVSALLLAGADVNVTAQKLALGQNQPTTSSSVADFLLSNPNKLMTQDMKYGGTPLHWSSSREIVAALIERGCDVNTLNFDGQTALHVMSTRNRLECVVELLSHDAEVDVRDKNGNSALHLAIEKKFIPIVQCLIVFGADINMKNKNDNTPRHMVGKEASGSNEDMILYILHSVGAKRCSKSSIKCPPGCNHNGTYNGIPPAQPESMEKRDHITTMLESTSRGARGSVSGNILNTVNNVRQEVMNSKNKEESALIDVKEERKGASVMDAILSMFTSTASKKIVKCEEADLSPTTSEKSQSDTDEVRMDTSSPTPMSEYGRGRVLCLDGGGIRGLVLAQMLLEIEKLAQTPITHLFDWIAGTSTGGILALALGCGKTMKQCMCLYLRMKDQAFVGSRPYVSDPLEKVLKDNLGEHTVMTDITHPKLLVSAVMADRKPVDLHIFRNYKCASDILEIKTPTNNRRVPPPPPEEQLVWRAARATGAAPSYFRAFGRFLDGGLIANNPTLDALTEIHEYNMALTSQGREAEVVPVSS